MEILSVQAKVAQHFVARAEAQGLKGKAMDKAALEFAIGAAAAAEAFYGAESPEWQGMSLLAFLVSVQGASALVKKVAA